MKGLIRKSSAWNRLSCLIMLGLVVGQIGCVGIPTTGSCGCSSPSGGCATCGGAGCDGDCADGSGAGRGGQWDLIDRCYPQRYTHMANKEVNAAMAPQVQNGHILDQTVWTYFFEAGTDRLTPGGIEHLCYLVRRRPCPDPVVYVQTANDLPFDPACPERYAAACQELDGRRVQAVQKFLVARSAPRPIDFQVVLHDPGDTTIGTVGIGLSIQQMYTRYRGGLPSAAGAGGGGGGGGAPAGGR